MTDNIDDQFICTGDTTDPVTIESATENATFTWTAVAETGINGLLNTSGDTNVIPAETLTLGNGITTPLEVVYTIIPSAPAGENENDCEGTPYTYSVTVLPLGQVNDFEDIIECAGEDIGPINFSTENTGGDTTYEWTNNNTAIGLAAAGALDYIPSFTTTAVLNSETAIISVTPTFTYNGVSCVGPIETFTITVNPVPQIDDSLNNAICHNESYTYSPVNGDDGVVPSGVTYSWLAPDTTDPTVQGTSGTDQNEFTTGIIEMMI